MNRLAIAALVAATASCGAFPAEPKEGDTIVLNDDSARLGTVEEVDEQVICISWLTTRWKPEITCHLRSHFIGFEIVLEDE